MAENNMARIAVVDSDSAFIIDPKTKSIIGAPEKNILAQSANKSERFSFYISTSVIEGHDLSTCNSIMVHYDNIEEKTLQKSSGIYSVRDFVVAKDGSASFSWLLDPDSTVYVGSLIFSIHFANIADDGTVDYDFPTLTYSKITVGSTVWNSETIAKQYPDILAGFDARINALESGSSPGGGSADAVLYTEQTLTDEQKAQARENIGAMAAPVGKFVALDTEIQQGYYDSGNMYEHPAGNYKCVKVDCAPGEIYRVSTTHYGSSNWPVAWIYNASKAEVGTATAEPESENDVKHYTDCEFTIPDGGSFFCVNCWKTGTIKVDRYEVNDLRNAVLYTKQTLADEQKAQARENIGAAPAEVGKYAEQNIEVQTGYYDGAKRYENANYRCVRVECLEGEKYRVATCHRNTNKWAVAWLYNANNQLVATAEGGAKKPVGDSQQITNCEFSIPATCTFFVMNCINPGGTLSVEKYEVKRFDAKPLYGKNAIYLGDSITYINDGWRPEFNALTGVNEVLCTAVSGAHLCDYEDTVVDGLDYTTGSKNTVSNQVQSIINDPPAEHIDLIIIAAGTNDHAQSAEFQGGVTQFVDENSAYIDVDTVDKTRYDGAMRWIAEKLWGLFPDAVIFFATPIQGAETSRQTWIQILKSDYMQEIATYLGTPVIDATRKSGIYGRYETANAEGKYLYDGLHPNSAGRAKLGRCYAAEVLNYFSYLQS